jgi:hypothetical protein
MFSLTLMSKEEKKCDHTVGGLRRIVQSFKVAINSKGRDCWHVYRQSVLVIDGKTNNVDGMFTGKNSGNNGMITGTGCRDQSSEEIALCTFQKCSRGPREGLAGGEKVETFEHLENLLSQRDQKAQEEEKKWSLDHQSRIPNVH